MKLNKILSYFSNSQKNTNEQKKLIEEIDYEVKNRKNINMVNNNIENIECENGREVLIYDNNLSTMTRDEFLQIFDRKINRIDPYFSREDFLKWARNIFINLYNLVSEKKYQEIEKFSTKEFMNSIKKEEVQEKLKITKDIDSIAVQYINLNGYIIDKENEIEKIKCEIVVNIIDNILNNDECIDYKNDNILYGIEDNNRNWYCSYILTFIRKSEDLIISNKNIIRNIKCSNCGASINIDKLNKKCDYCDSNINYESEKWKLESIELEN